jgi:hypothetical protein
MRNARYAINADDTGLLFQLTFVLISMLCPDVGGPAGGCVWPGWRISVYVLPLVLD